MSELNPANERIKRRYFYYLREAEGLAEITIDNSGRAIAAFEQFTGAKDFRSFSIKDAIGWRKNLLGGKGRVAAELSSRATVRSKLLSVQKFFRWLSQQSGFKSRIAIIDADYFDLGRRDRRIASERRNDNAPSLEQVQHVIRAMPSTNDCERRDQALMAFLLLTGARVMAITSFQLRHVMRDRLGVNQDARAVKTKGGRSFATYWFPVGDDILCVFLDWLDYLQRELLFRSGDPLFPATNKIAAIYGNRQLTREPWKTADPVRTICRRACEGARVPYFPPHTVRRTLAILGERMCTTGEELKAWSQNLGHLEVLTTMSSYGGLSDRRQCQVMKQIEMGTVDDATTGIVAFLESKGFNIDFPTSHSE